MVKDFFKMSNQESPPKTKSNVVGRSLSSRWKTTAKNRSDEVPDSVPNLDDRVPAADVEMMADASNTTKLDSKVLQKKVKMATDASSTTPLDGNVPTDNVNTMPDDSFMGHIGRSNKKKFAWNRTIKKLEDIYFQMDASPASVGSFDVYGYYGLNVPVDEECRIVHQLLSFVQATTWIE